MPFPADIVRLSFRGSLRNAALTTVLETFVHKIDVQVHHDGGTEFVWADEITNIANGIRDKFTTHFPLISARFPQVVKYDEVRAYHLAEGTGLTLDLAVAPFTALQGGGATSIPFECATAVSLYTYAAGEFNDAGRKGRGRFYLPPLASTGLTGEGMITTAFRDSISTWADTLLEDIQGMSVGGGIGNNTHLDVVVASTVDGVARQVQRSRVGSVIDVQRRRRRNLAEGYVDLPLSNH